MLMDFVGWSGLAPILYLIEFKIGLKADALKEQVTWSINSKEELSGCENYWFFGNTASFYARNKEGKISLDIKTKDKFKLQVKHLGKVYDYFVDGDTSLEIP